MPDPADSDRLSAVRDILVADYGLPADVELSRLPGENENYLVALPRPAAAEAAAERTARWVLKLEQDAVPGMAEVEAAAAAELLAARPGFGVPLGRRTTAGTQFVTLRDGRTGRLLEFVDGTAFGAAQTRGPELLRDLGRLLGQLPRVFAGVPGRAAARTHAWDLTAATQHWGEVAAVADPRRRDQLDRAFQSFQAHCRGLDELPAGLVHGDVNDENVLVDDERVVGLLDFGDALENPFVCDLAIALSYVVQHAPAGERLAAAATVVASYHGERELSAAELDVLFPLVLARLAVTLCMCEARRRIDPERVTWFVSEAPAVAALDELSALSPAAGSRAFADAVGSGRDGERSASAPSKDDLLARRRRHVNPALSVAYDEPLQVVRGRGQYLIDEHGRPHLDLVNNVCHVGHCHPHVVAAGQRQMAQLNTNTRYLYRALTDYAERLCATLPDELDTCFLVNSGSEANELALRLARAHTGRRDMIVLDSAYHGHTSALIALSPYKFMGKGGTGEPEPWVHVAPNPDVYRGPHRTNDRAAGQAYGDAIGRVIAASERPIAGLLCESLLSCGGQLVPPPGYLERAYEHVREHGGICIADEVQVGFGRTGRGYWAFELQDVVPEVVVLGKPIGNGHPMAAVVTTRAIARSFANGMEFFATFGGNPVSCAIGNAVLDVIEDERLIDRAARLGERFMRGLQELQREHAVIGDVRGVGLFLGVEIVADRESREPAPAVARAIVNRVRHNGVLLSTDGPFDNVLKIKPPMVLTEGDIDMALRALGAALQEIRS